VRAKGYENCDTFTIPPKGGASSRSYLPQEKLTQKRVGVNCLGRVDTPPPSARQSRRAAQIVREGPIGECFGEMDAAHLILAVEVRKSASDPQDAVITAGGKAHGVGRLA